MSVCPHTSINAKLIKVQPSPLQLMLTNHVLTSQSDEQTHLFSLGHCTLLSSLALNISWVICQWQWRTLLLVQICQPLPWLQISEEGTHISTLINLPLKGIPRIRTDFAWLLLHTVLSSPTCGAGSLMVG